MSDQLIDEVEIRNLVARLAHMADMAADLEEYLGCFTEDAVWEFPGNVVEGLEPSRSVGRQEIEADRRARRDDRFQGPGTDSRHLNTTLVVRVDGSDVAEAESYWIYVADTREGPTVKGMGHYHDHFRRTSGVWKLAHRRITAG